MAEGQAMSDDERISEIRDIHVAGVGIGAHVCANCYDEWPCDTAYLLARVDALTAGRDAATKRVATLENDLEHALASVGAFRQAIEDVWAKSAGESGDDGFIVSYVIPVGVLHRAIGLARGTDAGGKLLTRLAASEAARERSADRIRDALDCLPRALDGSQPFSMGQRAEVMLAIESLRAALAAASEEG